jgi:hypothetical protein
MREIMSDAYDRLNTDDPDVIAEKAEKKAAEHAAAHSEEDAHLTPDERWRKHMGEIYDRHERENALAEAEARGHPPPEEWPEDAKGKYAALPYKAQKLVLEQWGGLKSAQPQGVRNGRASDPAAPSTSGDRWASHLKTLGIGQDDAFNHLLAAEQMLRTGTADQKRNAAWTLIRDYNIDLFGAHGAMARTDPRMAALQAQLEAVRNSGAHRTQQANRQDHAAAESRLADFEARVGKSGQSRAAFQRVAKTMSNALRSGKAATLQDAYDQALKAATAAKSTTHSKPRTLREIMSDAYDRLNPDEA